jgi:hypothetical protein
MNRNIFKIFSTSFLILITLFALHSVCLAEKELEVDYPEILGDKPETVATTIPEYAKYIFTFSIVIIGLVAFGSLILGGTRYITSAGDPTKMQDAKEQIFSAILGVVILLSAYLILYNINPYLINIELTPLGEIEEQENPPPFEIENEKPFIMKTGDLFIVKKGINHRILAAEECKIMLIENKTTAHTGDVQTTITKSIEQQKTID